MSELDKLIPALVKFQSTVPAIPKDKENPFFKNKDTGKKAMYADLATILDVIRIPLTENGLCVSQPVEGETLATYLYHESGQFIRSEMPIMNDKKNIQGLGAAITYSRRYMLCSILSITGDDDLDGNDAVAAAKPPANTSTQPPQNTQPPACHAAKTPCSGSQQRRIETLWQELGRTEAALKKELQKSFGIDAVSQLGAMDAVAVIKSLNELVLKNAKPKNTEADS